MKSPGCQKSRKSTSSDARKKNELPSDITECLIAGKDWQVIALVLRKANGVFRKSVHSHHRAGSDGKNIKASRRATINKEQSQDSL